MRVGIVGAGAIGGWVGVRLARAGHAVSVLARGAALAALAKPWRLTIGPDTLQADVRASDDAAALGAQDLVVIALKGPALEAAALQIVPLVGERTIIVPAMNGVPWWFLLGGAGELPPSNLQSIDPRGAIAAALPFEQIVGCVVHASASLAEPGHVVHMNGNRLILGNPHAADSSRTNQVASALRGAGFDVEVSTEIRRDIWYKLWGNMTMNPISALTGATGDRILNDPLVRDFILDVMAEAASIGAGIGCPIVESGEDRIAVTRQLGAFKTSMLQDVEAGKAIELDELLGAPREIARRLGIATPNMDALFGLTRVFAQERLLYPGATGSKVLVTEP